MITYIYFVKCPDCEDEHFDFFDEAKEFALGCLTKKPIITQTEVTRNDFGECTDHCDLGTVWSWEDMMQDTTSEDDATVFSKNETFGISEGLDDFDDFDIRPQIDEFDNSLDYDFKEYEVSKEPTMSDYQRIRNSKLPPMTKDEFQKRLASGTTETIFTGDPREPGIRTRDYEVTYENGKYVVSYWDEDYYDDFTDSEIVEEFDNIDDLWAYIINFMEDDDFSPEFNYLAGVAERKYIPEGMTIEQLVEEMEENEDMVECKWCEELFPKEEGRFETGFGGLICRNCQNAAYARGEKMTYKDSDYWDFLDEDVDAENSDSLLEDFPYFEYSTDDVKATLIRRVLETPGMEHYIKPDGAIHALLEVRSQAAASGYRTIGYVTGFDVIGPRIRVSVARNDKKGEVYTGNLESMLTGTDYSIGTIYRRCPAYQVLRTLRDAANILNRELNPGVAVRRDRAVADTIDTLTPEVLKELKAHIVDITFEIPYDGYVDQELSKIDDQASDRQVKSAVKKLKDLHNAFYRLNFANDAKVETRYIPESEKISNILKVWGNEGNIKFDCKIDQLSSKAQEVIEETRFSSSALNKTLKQVGNYRLAKELCSRYGARFFEHRDLEEVYDLGNEYDGAYPDYEPELSEVDETPEVSDSHLKLCPECGKASFDLETGICIECGFN